MRSNGGVIGGKKTVSTSAASGIWAIRDQQREKGASNWPNVPFNATVTLLGGGGGGGAGERGDYVTAIFGRYFAGGDGTSGANDASGRLFDVFAG